MAKSSASLRRRLVSELEERKMITSPAVRRAFLRVPRELFVPEFAAAEGLEPVYRNQAIPTKKDEQGWPISSSSEPAIMAHMLECLDLRPGLRVLEVGAGTGYNAALISTIVGRQGRVTSVDVEPDLARKAKGALRKGGYTVRVARGDGHNGWGRGAPYDRIIVTASSAAVPKAWFEQLAPEGLLVLPLRLSESNFDVQVAAALKKRPDGFASERVIPGGFMPMRTEPGEPTRWIASTLYAGEWSPAGSRTFGSLRLGYSVKPTAPARRRLAALMFADPHATPLGMRLGAEGPGAGPYALNVFLALAVPESRLVTCFRDQRILAGVIAGRGFAVLGGTGKTITRIEAFGERSAGRLLASLVAEWRALGRPGVDHLRIRVAYDGHPRGAWRTFRRGEGWISFDWA